MPFRHEMIFPNEDLPFKMFLFEGKGGNYVRDKHWHRSVELFAVLEGELVFELNEKKYGLHPGEFILVNSNEVHSVLAPKPNRTVVLQIPLKTFERYFTEERYIRFMHQVSQKDEEVIPLIREMFQVYEERCIGYEWKVQSKYYMLIYLLVTRYRQTEINPAALHSTRQLDKLSRITEYIREHYKEELSLNGVAAVFGYSPTYLSRMFRSYAMVTYKEYLQNMRLELAVKEVRSTDHTMSRIALEHGFADSRAFAKAFRKKYGILPSEDRKKEKDKKVL